MVRVVVDVCTNVCGESGYGGVYVVRVVIEVCMW